jgi:peptidoglycan/LPS O-acetylase OafA/YrhL
MEARVKRFMRRARELDARLKAWRPSLPRLVLRVSRERAARDLAAAAGACCLATPFLAHAWLPHAWDGNDRALTWAALALEAAALLAGLAAHNHPAPLGPGAAREAT